MLLIIYFYLTLSMIAKNTIQYTKKRVFLQYKNNEHLLTAI